MYLRHIFKENMKKNILISCKKLLLILVSYYNKNNYKSTKSNFCVVQIIVLSTYNKLNKKH